MSLFNRLGTVLGICSLAAVATVGTAGAASPAGEGMDQGMDGTTQLGSDASPFAVSTAGTSIAAGGEGSVTITVKALGDHKVNQEYPHKVKLDDPPAGLELPQRKVTGGSLSKKSLTLSVPVKAKSAGKHTITGKVKFSVCNDSQCVIKKVPVTVAVTVK